MERANHQVARKESGGGGLKSWSWNGSSIGEWKPNIPSDWSGVANVWIWMVIKFDERFACRTQQPTWMDLERATKKWRIVFWSVHEWMNFSKHLGLERSQRAPSHRAREGEGSRIAKMEGMGGGGSLLWLPRWSSYFSTGLCLLELLKFKEL